MRSVWKTGWRLETKTIPMTNTPPKYAILVDGDSLDEAVEEAAHLLYLLLSRALAVHRRNHTEECGFEDFALETLAALAKHRNIYSHDVAVDPSEEG